MSVEYGHEEYVVLIREHLGVSEDDEYCDVTDPVDVNFYKNVWLKHASINTTVYDKVYLSHIHHVPKLARPLICSGVLLLI